MSLPYSSSSVEQQDITQRTKRSPSMLFTNDSSTPMQRVTYSHTHAFTRSVSQDQFYSFSSSVDHFPRPSDSEPQVYPVFHSNSREERRHCSTYDDSPISSFPERFQTRNCHPSQTDYLTTSVDHCPAIPGIKVSFPMCR